MPELEKVFQWRYHWTSRSLLYPMMGISVCKPGGGELLPGVFDAAPNIVRPPSGMGQDGTADLCQLRYTEGHSTGLPSITNDFCFIHGTIGLYITST